MTKRTMNNDDITDALINLIDKIGYCDNNTVTGFKNSAKKDILKSSKEGTFSKFTQEIIKRQDKKN